MHVDINPAWKLSHPTRLRNKRLVNKLYAYTPVIKTVLQLLSWKSRLDVPHLAKNRSSPGLLITTSILSFIISTVMHGIRAASQLDASLICNSLGDLKLTTNGRSNQYQALRENLSCCRRTLCREYINPEDVTLFVPVSFCHPDADHAPWRNPEEDRLLCVGHAAARNNVKKFRKTAGIHRVHTRCKHGIPTVNNRRMVFNCLVALGAILREEVTASQHTMSWSLSCVIYVPLLRRIISKTANADSTDTAW
jgi:hypothetical protein